MKNAIIAATVSAVVAASGAFAVTGELWSPEEAQYRLRWNDRELARCIILEANGQHERAKFCARFVRAHTSELDLSEIPTEAP